MQSRVFGAVALALGLVLSAPVLAQGPQLLAGLSLLRMPPQVHARLGLDDDQKKKLTEISSQMQQELRALFQGGGGGPEALQTLREKMQKAEMDAEAVLKPEQKTRYTAMKMEAGMLQGLGQSVTPLMAVEGISPEQKTKLKALSETVGGKRRELFQSLQGGGGNIQELRGKMQELDAETDQGIGGILTAEQLKVYQEAKKAMPQQGLRRRMN